VSIDKYFPLFCSGILVFDGAAHVFLVVFAPIDSNIVVLQIDQWSFLVTGKEMVLLFIIYSFEWFD